MRLRFALVIALSIFAASTAAARASVWMNFTRISNAGSTLRFTWQDDATGQQRATQIWRAGSGVTTNECLVAQGWLPAGLYDVRGHFDHYQGSKIQGRVWQLSDKRCNGGSGALRTELFIHSEETADNGQYCPTPGDDPFCWEGDGDYRSIGCIKVAHMPPYPSDIAQADNDWDAWDGRHGYFNFIAGLYVH
jgi:hypothetical protein